MSRDRSNTTIAVLTSTGLLALIAMVGLLISNKVSAESSAVSTTSIT